MNHGDDNRRSLLAIMRQAGLKGGDE